jgi:hypothetical protein
MIHYAFSAFSLSIIRIQITQAINPMAIRRMFTCPPMAGIISKSALKGAAIKFQKSVHIVFGLVGQM